MEMHSFRVPLKWSAFLIAGLLAGPARGQTPPPTSPQAPAPTDPAPAASDQAPMPAAAAPSEQTPSPEAAPSPPAPPQQPPAPGAEVPPPAAGRRPVAEGPPRAPAGPPRHEFPQALEGHFLKDPISTMFNGFRVTLLNFLELDVSHDSTQSFSQGDTYAGNPPLARSVMTGGASNYPGQHGRTVISPRNSQLGLQVESPDYHGIKGTAHCRLDFMGNQPQNPQTSPLGVSESAYYNSPTVRALHCYAKGESQYIDALAGVTYSLFGQQPFYFPASIIFLGIPGQVYTRAAQVRLSHQFHTDPVDVYIGAGVFRPPQRDSEVPDFEGAMRINFNDWKGVRTIGAVGTRIDPLSFGVSGVYRQFRVQEQVPVPQTFHKAEGAGISLDALVPVIPAKDNDHAGNSLTANASFATGTGIADQFQGVTGGVPAQTRPPATQGGPAGAQLDIDPGLALYDPTGELKTVNWQTWQVGLQYYLPGPLDIWIMGNYTHMTSSNLSRLAPPTAGAISTVFDTQDFFDTDIFWAITPNLQIAFGYANTRQTFLDGGKETNHRFMMANYFVF